MSGNNGAVIPGVIRGQFDPDGNVSKLRIDQRPLPEGLQLGTGFAANGFVYASAGLGAPTANIYAAKVGPDGELGIWSPAYALPVPLQQHEHVVVNDKFLYVIGGSTTAGAVISSIYVTELRQDGSLGPWRVTQPHPDGVTLQARAVYYAGYLFMTQGKDAAAPGVGGNKIWSAKIHSNGELDPWVVVGNTPMNAGSPDVRVRMASFLVDDLWVIAGGANAPLNPGTTPVGSVWSVRLKGDGTCGPAQMEPNALPIPTYTPFYFQWRKRLYVMGGNDTSGTRTAAIQSTLLDG